MTIDELIDAAPDPLVVLDVSGAIVLVNRRAERLLGYARDQLVGRPYDVLLPENARSTRLSDAVTLPSGDLVTHTVEITAQTAQGKPLRLEVSLSGLETDTRTLVVAAMRDVSARHQARADAESALRLRDAFLATVTHDLRQPVNVIRARAQLIQDLARELGPDPTVESIHIYAARIAATGTRMAHLVEELADVSSIQLGTPLVLKRTHADLLALVRAEVADLRVADQARIAVEAPDGAVVGDWDADRLRRVVDNLVVNALKYSPLDSKITVVVSRADHVAILQVRDRGIGIPPDEMEHIFGWFRRGRNAFAVAAGAGLGLAGVRHIVELHGGTISVESVVYEGSTFTVRLPLHAAE